MNYFIINAIIILIQLVSIFETKFIQQNVQKNSSITRYPLLIVPGDGGNQFFAKLNKSSAPHPFCLKKTNDYINIWLNLDDLTPYATDCLIDNLRLLYDPVTHTTRDNDGVDVKVFKFGETETMEYLDALHLVSDYADMVNAFVRQLNYRRGIEIRGAPYDWRKAPNELHYFFQNLTSLLIETYNNNKQTKVILVGHSMGNNILLYWLNNYLTKAQKDLYIRAYVSLSPPWGGSTKPFRIMASGDNINVPVSRPLSIRPYQRSAMSTAWLMPSDSFWGSDEVIISQPNQNYTVKDYQKFFEDLNYTIGYQMLLDTQNLTHNLVAPEVEYHALYGTGLKTAEGYIYTESEWPDSSPSLVYGDGDGTVNLRSFKGYTRWYGKQKESIFYKELPGVDHSGILKNKQTIDYILSLINN